MARIAGIDLPRNKRIEVALTYIFGIGPITSKKILAEVNVDPSIRTEKLTDDDVTRIRDAIEKKHVVEGELRRQVGVNIKRLMDLGCYRGLRHRKGLPCRGQRTKTNGRTRKGPKKTIAGKKQVGK